MAFKLPFVRWPGGLSKISTRVVRVLPPHRIYVEPFAGGLSVFWNKPPAEQEIIGDTNPTLMHFYDAARRGKLKNCEPVVQTKETFTELKACQHEDACCFLLHNRMAYDGAMSEARSPKLDGKLAGVSALAQKNEYGKRLRRVHLRIAGFDDTMRKWDGPDTLHFLDPPWTKDSGSAEYARKKYGRGHAEVTLERVIHVAKQMQGKVAIAYFDSPEARTALKRAGFKVYRIKTTKGGTETQREKRDRLLAVNFPIPESKRRKR